MIGTVHGYFDRESVLPGNKVNVRLGMIDKGPARVPLALKRVARTMEIVWPKAPEPEEYEIPRRDKPKDTNAAFGWDKTLEIEIKKEWKPGLYVLSDKRENHEPEYIICWLVVRAPEAASTPLLLHVPTLTHQAYGWSAFYPAKQQDRKPSLSLDRSAQEQFAHFYNLARWLAENGYEDKLHYGSSIDLHRAALHEEYAAWLRNYRCLVLGYHDEYWTPEMRDAVEQFVTVHGRNVVSLSGNTLHRQVRLDEKARKVYFYKQASNDPEPNPRRVAVSFVQSPPDRPQNAFFGFGFTGGAFGHHAAGYRFHKQNAPSWVFDNVPADQSSAFLSYETDAVDFARDEKGTPYATGESGAPRTCAILATADLSNWIKPGFATMSLLRRNGMIFSGGSTNWVYALPRDAAIQQITRNVLAKLASEPSAYEDCGELPVGAGENVRGLAFIAGRLFLAVATSDTHGALYARPPVCGPLPRASWHKAGHVHGAITMCASLTRLYAVTGSNVLWQRAPALTDIDWTTCGNGPSIDAKLAFGGGLLYATDQDGALQHAAAPETTGGSVGPWRATQAALTDKTIRAIAYDADILYAARGKTICRTNNDLIAEGNGWMSFATLPEEALALTIVDRMLFAASKNRLYAIDLYGRRVTIEWPKTDVSEGPAPGA